MFSGKLMLCASQTRVGNHDLENTAYKNNPRVKYEYVNSRDSRKPHSIICEFRQTRSATNYSAANIRQSPHPRTETRMEWKRAVLFRTGRRPAAVELNGYPRAHLFTYFDLLRYSSTSVRPGEWSSSPVQPESGTTVIIAVRRARSIVEFINVQPCARTSHSSGFI